MHRPYKKHLAALTLAVALTTASVHPAVFADGGVSITQSSVSEASLGSVYITDNSYIEIKQASILAGDEGKTVSFTLTFYNGDDYEHQFIDYWVRLVNDSGTAFTVNVLPQDKDKNRVPAFSKMDVNLYAKVNSATELNELNFRIIKWDFSAPNYERKLGAIPVPDDYSVVTPTDSARDIQVSGTKLKTAITRLSLGRNEKFYLPKVQLSFENKGNKTADLPNYQYAVRTSEGLLYPLQAQGITEQNKAIYPRFVKEVELSGSIPTSVEGEGWELVITTQADVSGTKLTLPVAFFAIPAPSGSGNDGAVPPQETKSVDVGSNTMDTSVTRVVRSKNEAYYHTSVYFSMKNTGTSSIQLPNYRFAIKTSDGLSYPAKAEGLTNLSIDPLVSKEIQLTASIPSSVNADGWKLVLLPAAEGTSSGTSDAAIASYALPDGTGTGSGSIGATYEFTNKSGIYSAKLNSIQRLPWEDQDIISANLSISNKGSGSLPVPSFTGYFLLDDAVKIPAQAIVKDNIISLKGNGNLSLQVYGKIPYTNEYTNIKLVLQEKAADNAVNDLLEFRTVSIPTKLSVVDVGQAQKLEGVGRRSEIKVKDVRTYSGEGSDLFAAVINVTNLEKRFSSVPSLVAYFKTSDDTIYPATLSEIKKKINPQGVATLYVHASMPSNMSREGVVLVIGSGVKDGKLSEGVQSDAYIDAMSYKLPKEKEAKKDFRSLELYPYQLDITSLQARLKTITQFSVKFNYNLKKNQMVEFNKDEHKLIMVVKDRDTDFTFTEVLTLDKDGEKNLALGDNTLELLVSRPDLLNQLIGSTTYDISLYDEFQGQRKLVATSTAGL